MNWRYSRHWDTRDSKSSIRRRLCTNGRHGQREGMYVDHKFEFDATGLFGEESPGPWLSYSEAIARNAAIQVQSKGFGLWRRTPGLNRLRDSWGSWYDFHAALPIITDAAGVGR